MEILTGVERRRRWSSEEKLEILREASAPGSSVGAVARRHDISRSQIYQWRRAFRSGRLRSESLAVVDFLPVEVCDQLPNDVAALQAIIAKQAAELEDAKNQLKARDVVIEQLQLNLDKLKRSQFGQSSEKLQHQIDQLGLALEDLQTDRAAEKAEANSDADDETVDGNKKEKKKRGRKKLPAHLPRERSVLDPGDACPDCGGEARQWPTPSS